MNYPHATSKAKPNKLTHTSTLINSYCDEISIWKDESTVLKSDNVIVEKAIFLFRFYVFSRKFISKYINIYSLII